MSRSDKVTLKRRLSLRLIAGLGALLTIAVPQLLGDHAPASAHDAPVATAPPAERDEWILLSRRVHGGFGSLIALGIRIGDDAIRQLGAAQRELDVTYHSGARAPCPCVVDGILIATQSSPGQGTLRVSADPAPDGEFGRVFIRHKTSGRTLLYVMPASVGPMMAEINKLPSLERWAAVMQLADDQIFTRAETARTD
jgi:hypothetical protein